MNYKECRKYMIVHMTHPPHDVLYNLQYYDIYFIEHFINNIVVFHHKPISLRILLNLYDTFL